MWLTEDTACILETQNAVIQYLNSAKHNTCAGCCYWRLWRILKKLKCFGFILFLWKETWSEHSYWRRHQTHDTGKSIWETLPPGTVTYCTECRGGVGEGDVHSLARIVVLCVCYVGMCACVLYVLHPIPLLIFSQWLLCFSTPLRLFRTTSVFFFIIKPLSHCSWEIWAELFENALQTRGIWKRRLYVLVRDRKHFQEGDFRKLWRHDNHVISLPEFSSKTKWLVIITNEYMQVHVVFELRRMTWRYDWSSQLYTQLQ